MTDDTEATGPARTEITDRMLIFGQQHLRTILAAMRPTTTDGGHTAAASSGRHGRITLSPTLSRKRIERRPVLGGLINDYERAAKKTRPRPAAKFWNPTSAARIALSAQDSDGVLTWRWSTATWWRKMRISVSSARSDRASKASQLNTLSTAK